MKVLRFLVILLLILVVGFLLLCIVSPSELKVERSTTINAPKALVWDQIVNFKNWERWSSWKEGDSTIVVDYSGTDGQVGSKYHYVGKESGEGYTINEGVSDGEMKYKMEFITPFKAEADGYYKVADDGGKTKVIWYFHENMNFMMRGFAAILRAKSMLESKFDRGLELMKIYCEAHATEVPAGSSAMNIVETEYPAHIYAGVRAVTKWADMQKFFGDAYSMVSKEAGARIAGPASALYWTWDEKNMQADMMACFPVSDDKPVKGATIEKVAASHSYMMHYVGPYSGFKAAHDAMGAKLSADKKQMSLVIEEYINDPMTEKDSTKLQTNIYYLVK